MATAVHQTWHLQYTEHGNYSTLNMETAVQQTWQLQYTRHGNCTTFSTGHRHFHTNISPNGSTLHKTWHLHLSKHSNCIFNKHGSCISVNMAIAFQHMCREYNIFQLTLAFAYQHAPMAVQCIKHGNCTSLNMENVSE